MKLRITGLFFILALLTGCAVALPVRAPYRFLIPRGYVGWVEVRFGIPGAPELPVHEGFKVVRFPKEGVLNTASPFEEGWAKDEYYYAGGETLQPLSEGYQTGMINAGASGIRGMGNHQSLWFFVGTYEQYMKYGCPTTTSPTIGPIALWRRTSAPALDRSVA